MPIIETNLPEFDHIMLRRGFPFYVEWDDDLRICTFGPSFEKICQQARVGLHIKEIFALLRPVGEMTNEFFRSSNDMLFLFSIIGTNVTLRGEILMLESRHSFLLLGAPWIDDPEEVARLGLTLSDFAIHDQTMDLLQVLQTQRMANDDLQRLAQKLTNQRTQLRIKEAETRKLALIAARTDNAVIMTDAQGRIEWVNEGYVRLTEWSMEESLGKTPGALLQGPETDPITATFMREKLKLHEGFRTDVLNYTKSGKKYWVSVEIQPIFDDKGQLTNFMGVETDITQKKSDESRRNMQHSVTRILASDRSLSDAGGKILRAICQGLGSIIGYFWRPAEEENMLILSEIWHEPSLDCRALIQYSKSLIYTKGEGLPGKVWQHEQRVWLDEENLYSSCRRAETFRALGLRSGLALPIFHNSGFQGVMEFFSTSTENPDNLLNDALEGISYQIGQFIVRKKSQVELLRAKESAENANRAKSDFLATMSHEIRTPMNGVVGFANLLNESQLSEQQQEFVTAIVSSAESLLRVINDVLDFSKIESGHMEIESSPFSLQMCIEEAVETISANAAEKHLDLAAFVHADVPSSILGDSLRLKQVLVNLLGNAVKFTHAGEVKIEVHASHMSDQEVELTFAVKDTGIGIAADRIDYLFAAFQQEDSSTSRRFGGSGLGLAICKRLVELMGGSISVQSVQGQGSSFSFRLAVLVSSEPGPLIGPLPCPDLLGKRLLLVDGHNLSREVLADLLQRWGLEVRSASSTAEAAKHLQDWLPQFLMIDSRLTDIADVVFAKGLAAQGVAVFIPCRAAESKTMKGCFGIADLFTVSKPIKVSPLFNALISHANARSSASPVKNQPISKHTPMNGLRLLLAEDNKINQKLALAILSQLGYQADLAKNGEEALHAAIAKGYDAILMDVQMPTMDGLEATRRIRQWESETGSPPIHIIALTANALVGDREVCLAAGMDDYLSKPIRVDALRTALKNASHEKVSEGSAEQEPQQQSSAEALRKLAEQLSLDDAVTLATEFLSDLEEQIAEIRNALEKKEYQHVRRFAHSLKGTASIFDLSELQAVASNMEDACHEDRYNDAAASLPALVAAAKKADDHLRKAISSISSSSILENMS
jgi:PAS domain S-box-containing protein